MPASGICARTDAPAEVRKDGPKSARLLSLDALRGADMLMIMGFGPLVRKVCAALGHAECGLAQQFRHVPWDGLHVEDAIFPLFLFIAGVSFPYSCAKLLARGTAPRAIALNAPKRAATMLAAGLAVAFGFGAYSMPLNKILWSSS